ncbi:MAG: M20/M25/M40 family metallo-hydrolase [Planctomycetes bacterium]|nr:M20/M25/M40 family metallo-hydrolase [Planctomycetota bacterium]
MKFPLPGSLFFPIFVAALQAQQVSPPGKLPEGAPPAMAEITAERLQAHADWLADDARAGRLTGSPGQQETAEYVARHFQQLGLEPLGDEQDGGARSFFQSYRIARTAIDPTTKLTIGTVAIQEGYAALGTSAEELAFAGKARFLGLGRTRGIQKDMEADETLEQVLPVMLIKGPRGALDRQLGVEEKFGMAFQPFGNLGKTAKNLQKKGAKAAVFLLLDDPLGLCDVLNYLALSPGKDQLEARFPGGESQMAQMGQMLGGDAGIPTLVLGPALAGKVLAELGIDGAAARAWMANEGEKPTGKADVEVALTYKVTSDPDAHATNVVAVLRGSDRKLGEEAIVFSAHMDHVGKRMDGEVFNGADDNASGTSGLLEIARAFAALPEKPKRTVIFLSVSGEELGLWGSRFYSDHPTWPADKIVANINTDMIGRSGPESGADEVTVTPSNSHPKFSTLVQVAAGFGEQMGMKFTSGDKYYTRSDHYNFARLGIPVVFFCNGEHEDYHQVTDHADKLDSGKMQKIARLAFWTGFATAQQDEKPYELGERRTWK